MGIIREKLPLLAILIALSVVLGLVINIPIPGTNGYVNLLDVGIYTAALTLGGPAGLLVGASSGLLLDLLLGYPQWMFFSLVIHGLQGYLVGILAKNQVKTLPLLGLILGSFTMVIGYYLATWLLYGHLAGLASLPSNALQVIVGIIGASSIVAILNKQKMTLHHW